jgi:phosphate/sulfate permease
MIIKNSSDKTDDDNTSGNGKQEVPLDSEVVQYCFRQAIIQCEAFRILMVSSALLVCIALGSNDVANAISPLLVLMNAAE